MCNALRRIVALCIALFLVAAPAYAAGGLYGNLRGTVVDAATRAPIAGASVVAKSPSGTYSAQTDAKGFFMMLGMAVDGYTVTIAAPGHEDVAIAGVVVFGDETGTVGTVALITHLKTIASVSARSVSNVFQPQQTTDSYTVNQQQILQSTGKLASTNENSALLAVPGVTQTNNNSATSSTITIRGGAAPEVGYQYDGVPFKEPFQGANGSASLMNGIGTIQVVEGAGDATQAGVGAGVINVIPQRGSGPGSGMVDFEVGGPNFSHQAGFNYGFSTPNNRVSEYMSYIGQHMTPYYGFRTSSLADYGNYFASTYLVNDQFTNNFFYKFGKNLDRQVQVLYANISQQAYGSAVGGSLAYYPYDQLSQAGWQSAMGYTPSQYSSLIGLAPGVPSVNAPVTSPQQNSSLQSRLLKIEYDASLNPSTYLALRYYNWEQLAYSDNQHSMGPWGSGGAGITDYTMSGGPTIGMNLDLVKQVDSHLTVTLNGQFNVLYPVHQDYEPQTQLAAISSGTGLANQPVSADWLSGGYLCGGNTNGPGGAAVDYFNCASPGGVSKTRIPTWGIDYNGAYFQTWGVGLRLQYAANDRLKFDLGLRDEGQNQHWFGQLDKFNQGVPATGTDPNGKTVAITNPFDVPASMWTILRPTALQPRGSISLQLSRNDSMRFSYGRSAVFWNSLTAGTPFNVWGIEPYLSIPAKPGSTCGWTASATFPCKTFAQQLYWMGDNMEAPDVNTGVPAIYTNFDFSYSHLFKNGWGMRVTPFFKRGTNLPANYLLNPVLGIFVTSNQGQNKTSGVEFGLTTPQRRIGLSGFFTATYQNVLSSTPPFTVGETTVPLESLATLSLGNLYRAGYVSPFSIRIGGVENLKNGLSISPQLSYNIGYPYSVGNLIAACIQPSPNGCAKYANIPQVNFGPGITGGQSSLVGTNPGSSISTNYYDPAYPGLATNPNIIATRGTPATSSNGGKLSRPNLNLDLSLEWKVHRNTLGLQVLNLFGNAFNGAVPAINPWYQPVANGISGPQTGYNTCVAQTGLTRGCVPYIPRDSYAFTNGAYVFSNGNFTGTPSFGPIRPLTFQVYFQRTL